LADPFYLEPTGDVLQGDIYVDTPSLEIATRPLLAARPWNRPLGNPPLPGLRAHREDADHPRDGFHWSLDPPADESDRLRGESVVVPGYRGLSMVMTHDCEIENDPDFRVMAMIRPISAVDKDHQADVLGLAIWPYFPLAPQSDPPVMQPCFVDFRRLTTVRASALRADDRYAAVSDVVREAVALRFWLFLFRRILQPGEAE
jgi:hypothetical protein